MNKAQRVLILGLSLLAALVVAAGALGASAAPLRQDPTPTPAPGAPATAICDELQVIAIADQSGSMAGYTDETGRYYPPTDPNGMRFDGPEFVVNTLLGAHGGGFGSAQFRAAVIDFGDVLEVRMGWTDLNPLTPEEALAQTGALAPTFNPTQPLGNTLPGAAVEQAASLFSQMDAIRPQANGCPQRLIILFTDGLPFDDVAGFNWQTHLTDLAGYARAYLPYPDNRIYVIGLDQNGGFHEQTVDRWAEVTGSPDRVMLARDTVEMGSLIGQILYEALATTGVTATARGCAEDGQIIVPPYMQQVRITLFKADPNLHLEMADPAGQPVLDGQAGVTITGQAGVVETLTVSNPQPGAWRVLTQLPPDTEDKCQVNFIAIAAQEQVLDPPAGASFDQFTNVPVTFQLVDSSGNALPDYGEDQYDLQMNVGLSYDGGQEQAMTWSANPGQQYRGEVVPYFTGAAGVVVDATAQDDNSANYVIFPQKAITSFQVDPVSFVGRQLPDAGARLGQFSEVPLEFAVVDSTGQPLELDLPVNVELALTDQAGQATPLPTPSQSGGVYSGTLTLDESGVQTLSYVASVTVPPQGNQPESVVELGRGQVSVDVFPVNLIRAEFGAVGGVATDPFLRPTGLPLEVQLTDGRGQAIGPATTGAPNPMQIFEVTIRDQADGEVVLQGKDLLTTTGEPGVFQLVDNELGRGAYTVAVRPATTVADDFIWDGTEWTTEAVGTLNPLFWGVLAAAGAALGLVGLVTMAQVRVRQHPMSGRIQIYEKRYVSSTEQEGVTEESERTLLSETLPANKNSYTFRPNVGGINKIVLTSLNDDASKSKTVQAKIYVKNNKDPLTTTLPPNGKINIPGTQVYVAKDRRPTDDGDADAFVPTGTFN